MAQDRQGPWSRWDGMPENSINGIVNNRQFDTRTIGTSDFRAPAGYLRTGLVDQRINAIDPSFYDCVYGLQNTAATVVEQCYKNLGCCAHGCCKNSEWNREYAAAIVLICIFGFLVIVAVVVSLLVWLFNRAKDKKAKQQFIQDNLQPPISTTSSYGYYDM